MEVLTANLSGKIRKATLHGRPYYVAPVKMIVPGVLNGSEGKGFYSAEENRKKVNAWNGRPLMATSHPKRDGRFVSALSPDIFDKQYVGDVFNAEVNDAGELIAEAWFDVDKTRKVDDRIVKNLESGKPIELSTGLGLDKKPAEEGATFNGESYDWVATNYDPDHLAILTESIGACSIKDGCGVLVNEEGLEASLRERFGTETDIEVFNGFVIYEEGDDLMRLEYSEGKLSPSPTKVRQVFEPVSNEEGDVMDRKAIIEDLTTNSCGCWTKDDVSVLEGFSDERLQALVDNAEKAKKTEEKLAELTANAEAAKKEDEKTANKKAVEAATKEGAKELTGNALSDEDREDLAWARAQKAKQKEQLVERLTANLDESKREAASKVFNAMTLGDLQEITPTAETTKETPSPSYVGAAGGVPTTVNADDLLDDEPLALPTMGPITK